MRNVCSSHSRVVCIYTTCVCGDCRIQRVPFLLFSRQICPARTRSRLWARFIRARTSWHWNTSPTRGAPSRTASVSLSPPSRIQVSTFPPSDNFRLCSFVSRVSACYLYLISFLARNFRRSTRYRRESRRDCDAVSKLATTLTLWGCFFELFESREISRHFCYQFFNSLIH